MEDQLDSADYWLWFASEADYNALFKQMCKGSAFRQLNAHLTDADIAELHLDDAEPPIFDEAKPYWSAYALTKKNGYYSQVRPPYGGSKIYCHRVSVGYVLKFRLKLTGDALAKGLKESEGSHLLNNYAGHQRDFNPNNIYPEAGLINKSRDACVIRNGLRLLRKRTPNASLTDLYVAYSSLSADEAILSQEEISQADQVLSQINEEASTDDPAGPSTRSRKRSVEPSHDCCGEVHDPKCKSWNPQWGAIPAAVALRQ
jgi:hypothetical protein